MPENFESHLAAQQEPLKATLSELVRIPEETLWRCINHYAVLKKLYNAMGIYAQAIYELSR